MKKNLLVGFSAVLILAGFSSAEAFLIDVYSNDNGWYMNDGTHFTTNTNTYTGYGNSIDRFYNSFYNFDVSPLAGNTITSVELTFLQSNGFYSTPDDSETLQIYDVTTTPGLGNSVAVFNDLETGNLYGETVVPTPGIWASMPMITISLSSLSFSDILADSFFSLGAHVSSIGPNGSDEVLWSSSGDLPAAKLAIEYTTGDPIPEPATILLFGTGIAGLVGSRLRRKK